HDSAVVGAAFSPDGRQIATASWDKTVRLWNAADGMQIGAPFDHDKRVLAVAFSPDGRQILSVSEQDRTPRLLDVNSRKVTVLEGHEDAVRSATFSPDGKRIGTASADNTARIWSSDSDVVILRGHARSVAFAAF